MAEKKSRAPVLAHRDTAGKAQLEHSLTHIVTAALRGVKYMGLMLASLAMCFVGIWLLLAPIEGPEMSWSAALALFGTCLWCAVTLYRLAEPGEGGDGHDGHDE